MSWTTEQSEANADLNAQEFANTQRVLRGSGPPTIPAPLHVEYIDESVSPNLVYRKTGPLATDWTLVNFTGGGGSTVNGAVFITDIVPQGAGNVGTKVFSSGGKVLDTCVSDTDLITVSVITQMGHTNYEPVITVLGQAVTLTEDEDQSIFTGSVDIDRLGATAITAQHEDGASHTCTITNDVGPEVQTATFTGGKPGTQTELKENDAVDLVVTTDIDMIRIQVDDFGAAQPAQYDFAATTTETITLTIADRGNTPQALGVRLRAMNANGSWGNWFLTTSAGSDEDENVVTLNNTHPAVSAVTIDYPVGQAALKDSESATVNHTITDFDTVVYSSPNGDLTVLNGTTYEPAKSVSRIGGNYNIDTENFRIVATRAANDASTPAEAIVQIAHVSPQLTIATEDARLRSGGNAGTSAQDHTVTLTSDQLLDALPVIIASEGTLQGSMTGNLNQLEFTQVLQVHDDDAKGIHTFGLTSATNLAGKTVTALTGTDTYEIGGFVTRTLSIAAFGNEVAIGTDVSDTTKLIALDKDLAALTYAADLDNALKTYTITGPTGVLNATGNLWHWNDQQAVNNNTTGGATVTLEESV